MAGAVELRKELAAATSLDLPPMLVFDYPTAAGLSDHLLALMLPKPVAVPPWSDAGSQPVMLREVTIKANPVTEAVH